MRVLTLTHNLPRFPGDFSGVFIDDLCRAMIDAGAEVGVLAPDDQDYAEGLERPYGLHTYRYAWPRARQTVGYMRSMMGDLKPRPASLLVTPLSVALGACAAIRLIRQRRPDVIHAHWLLPNGLIAALASRATGVPFVVSLPGSDLLVARMNAVTRAMARFVLTRAALVTTNSRELAEVAYRLGAPADAVELIVYGVDPQRTRQDLVRGEEVRRSLGLAPSDFAVLAVGRMVPKKGFRYLTRALPELQRLVPGARLVFVGDGPERGGMEQMASAMGLRGSVTFLGTVPNTEIARVYSAADALCMPSVTEPEDGLNVCVLDAMSCGLPVVASNVAGNPLVVEDGANGYIVPERDVSSLAKALARLGQDRPRARALGEYGHQRVLQEFAWSHLARRYLDHFAAIASPPASTG